MDPVLKYLAVGRQLGYGFYLLLDAISYFDTTGIYKLQSGARIAKEAYRAWFVGLACNIAAGVYTLYNLQVIAKKQAQSGGDAEKKVELKTLERYVRIRGAVVERRSANSLIFVGRKLLRNCSCCRMFAILLCLAVLLAWLIWMMALLVWRELCPRLLVLRLLGRRLHKLSETRVEQSSSPDGGVYCGIAQLFCCECVRMLLLEAYERLTRRATLFAYRQGRTSIDMFLECQYIPMFHPLIHTNSYTAFCNRSSNAFASGTRRSRLLPSIRLQ